ncbi:MAG: PP2C family protein-serine/threonine phosphatase [Planctomycetota bacterium]
MLSQRNIEKRVADALGSDDRWRVIVRGNNWLCPYCLKIGARDLRMDEAIEEKLALHFVRGCPAWNYFNSDPEPIERLRHRARYLVFKLRVLRWLLDDRRFRYLEGERWLCPYCLGGVDAPAPAHPLDDLTAWGEAPEESPFLEHLVSHLLQCEDFSQGEDRLRSVRELDEARTRQARRRGLDQLEERFRREPSYQLVDGAQRWLCPFCAQAQEFTLPGPRPPQAFFEAMARHLALCKARKVLDGQPRPVEELKEKVQGGARANKLDKLRRKLTRHAVWRVRDLEGQWYCPYCASGTLLGYPDKSPKPDEPPTPEVDRFLSGVLQHLSRCPDYKGQDPRVRSREELAEAVQARNLELSGRRRVRRLLTSDPLFAVVDPFANWLCPYCKRVQGHVTLDADEGSATFEKTVELVTRHLYEECDAASEDPPRARRDELEALVRRQGLAASGVRERGVAAPPDELEESRWHKIKQDIDHLASQAAAHESSLQEARSKQLRLLPALPRIEGFEFGRVYKPCDAVGGDFYHLFPVGGDAWGVAIGDISGHGIEAALLMGLAKKLIEVHGRGVSSAAQALCLANQDIFSDLDERTFVTAFYGVLDLGKRRFRFARAGHNSLILYNPARTPPLQVIGQKGMALGVDAGPLFEKTLEELEVTLEPGDLVFQFTDGVSETLDEEGEQFGEERLCEVIAAHGHHEVEYVLWKVERALDAFRGAAEQADDVTMIGFKVLA